MSKASQLLDELKNLDTDIQSRIDEVRTLEAGLLSSPKWSTDKVKGGKPTKVDDVYAQLIVLKCTSCVRWHVLLDWKPY